VTVTTDVDARARRWVWIAAIGYVATIGLVLLLEVLTPAPPASPEDGGGDLAFILIVVPFTVAALLILAKQPRNRIGWILMAIGYAWIQPLGNVGELLLSRGLPGGAALVCLTAGSWAPPIGLMGTVLLLRFPTGEPVSPRWRWVERLAVVDLIAIVGAIAFMGGDLAFVGYPDVRNPFAVGWLQPLVTAALPIALPVLPITIVLSAASLVVRFRRSRGVERLQMKWFTTAAGFVALLYLVAMLGSIPASSGGSGPAAFIGLISNLSFFSFILIPIAIAIAVLRYRLYEIDVVISKAIVYGALALFVTAAYVGIVVGLGRLFGSDRSVLLQITATVMVAVAFQPLRELVQRFANRLVYGRRATPYEVLARFSEQVAGSYATDEIALALARLLVEGTGATRSEIWLRTGGEPRLEATWPAEARSEARAIPERDDLTRVVPVVHRGETLGDLVIRKAPNDPVGPNDEKLLDDVAGQAGLVLRNVRLVEDLRASRLRLVAARDTERRKLERNIHDGAQQRLVALAVLYNMAAGLAAPLGEEHRAALADLGAQSQAALGTLRDLARGIYPAVLSDRGLVAALEGQARKTTIAVEIEADGLGRYDQDVEAAVYFSCLEALQNVAKYAQARRVVVRLAEKHGTIRFEVRDDGIGFERSAVPLGSGMRNMEDRLVAIGGWLEVRSSPGAGTTVVGRVPVDARTGELAVAG
jgi:signal transduction histidine kinase